MKQRNTIFRVCAIGAVTFALVILALWSTGNFPPAAYANSGGGVTYRTLTKCSPTGGTILNNPTGTTFVNNVVVTLTADPNPGYDFSGWTGSVTGSTNPINLTMNANKSVCATFVVDSTIPVITRTGDATVYVECGEPYTDAGATATDNRDGNITSRIVVGGDTVDVNTPGTYVITYNVQDDAENWATEVTRTVIVEDTEIPVITLLGDDPVDTPLGEIYTDAGATAEDGCDGDLTENIVVGGDTVDSNTLGTYVITYDVEDTTGHDAVQVTRTVNVVDTTPPVINLVGDDPLVIAFESTYSDPGATATDNVDGDLTTSIVVSGDTVNTAVSGDYTVYYDVADAAGNDAERVSRVVTVLGPPQSLTVEGPMNGDVVLTPPHPAHVVESGSGTYIDDYDFGTEVFLNAVPETGYVFWGWGGDLSGASPEVFIADEFDDQALDPAWTVAAGTWAEAGDEHLSVAAEASVTPQLTRSQSIADLNIQLDYRRVSGNAPFDIVLRWEDTNNHLFLSIDASQILLKEKISGTTGTLASATGAASGAGEWYHLEIELNGAEVRVWRKPIEGPETLLLSANATTLETGQFGFVTGANTAYDMDMLILRDLKGRASLTMDEPHTVSAEFLPLDTVPPTLNLLGEAEMELDCGETFTDPGATAYDERHGIITQNIMVGGDAVDLDTPGTYTITYDVMDRDGNAAVQVTRDVVVGDTTPPVITLLGDNPMYLARNGTYTDPGATAADNCDTALPTVTVNSTDIDSATFGSYIVTYNVSDAESNAATQVTRTVIVAPILTMTKTNAGNTTPALGSHFHPLNTVVSLSATPPANFSHWEGDDINLETDNPINITMNGDKSVTAVFHAGIYFPDANLELAVRNAISKPTGTILPSDLESLTSLDAGDYGITNISGIQQIASLTSLVLSDNSISDLAPLAFLTGLTHLELSGVNPASLSPVASLTALVTLDLSGNGLEDVAELEGLAALTELDLSDNAIEDLQGLIDTRILEDGTLDLTDNPLGPLAWHVQLALVEGHVEDLTYNDTQNHESDGLRTLVAGVKQGLGTISVNTVPTGGVEEHELRNYENETYDLWLAEYPVDTGEFDAPSNPVSLTAVPTDGDGHLDYWMGSYLAHGPRDEAELSVILYEDTKINAVIEGRPGLGALDLVADFEDFVAEVLPAEDWETLDENGITYDGELNPLFTGNGIPDVAELGLLNAVLKDSEIDFAARSGVVNQFAWEAWAANLAEAEAQLYTPIPTLASKPYLARIVAAYLTLGEYESVAWIDTVMDTYTAQDVLELDAYDRSEQRYFKFEGDADNDGAWNADEWQGLALTGILLDDIAAYAEAALDPAAQPSAAKSAGGISKQLAPPASCPNANCIPSVTVRVWDPQTPPIFGGFAPPHANTLIVTRMDTGGNIAPGSSEEVPIGTEIKVEAKPDTGRRYKFLSWAVSDTLINWSRNPKERFYVTADTFILAGFTRNLVMVPKNSQYVTYSVGGGYYDGPHPNYPNQNLYYISPDTIATLSGRSTQFSRAAWVLKGCTNCADPSHNRTNPTMVRGAGFAHIASISLEEKQATVTLVPSRGGDLLGSANPYNAGRVWGSVTAAKNGMVRVDARPHPGYEFSGFAQTGPSIFSGAGSLLYNGPNTNYVIAGKNAIAAAKFEKKIEYNLKLKLEGEDVPCSGYVTVTPAMQYYLPGTRVTLTATPLPGYRFVEWTGDPAGLHPAIYLGDPELDLEMEHNFKVGAKFAKEFLDVPIEAFNPDTCEYCIHGGTPNDGFLVGDVRFGALPEGLGRYPATRDTGGDDWGCAYYIHQKLIDAAATWYALHPGDPILFNDISKEGGGPWDHNSHQNGLDVDIANQGNDTLTNELIAIFTADGDCELVYTSKPGITITGKVQWESGHNTHFHVRYKDPDGLEN